MSQHSSDAPLRLSPSSSTPGRRRPCLHLPCVEDQDGHPSYPDHSLSAFEALRNINAFFNPLIDRACDRLLDFDSGADRNFFLDTAAVLDYLDHADPADDFGDGGGEDREAVWRKAKSQRLAPFRPHARWLHLPGLDQTIYVRVQFRIEKQHFSPLDPYVQPLYFHRRVLDISNWGIASTVPDLPEGDVSHVLDCAELAVSLHAFERYERINRLLVRIEGRALNLGELLASFEAQHLPRRYPSPTELRTVQFTPCRRPVTAIYLEGWPRKLSHLLQHRLARYRWSLSVSDTSMERLIATVQRNWLMDAFEQGLKAERLSVSKSEWLGDE